MDDSLTFKSNKNAECDQCKAGMGLLPSQINIKIMSGVNSINAHKNIFMNLH